MLDIDMSAEPDDELDRVRRHLEQLDPGGVRVGRVIRDTLDQLYDGQHTGRWSVEQLFKTEKTHMGTLVEINLHREFGFDGGSATDYRIAGVEVDCKFSMTAVWMMPPEVIGHLALVVSASDTGSTWSAGILRVHEQYLNQGRNRDGKGSLNALGRTQIRPLWGSPRPLAPNLFLTLPEAIRESIFAARSLRSPYHGQARVNQLFRTVQHRIIRRAELATVAQQDDPMKRARSDGGSRTQLRPEGILVLGHQSNDPLVAQALELPVPTKGEFVSARVVPFLLHPGRPYAVIEGCGYTLADADDDVYPAPYVPR